LNTAKEVFNTVFNVSTPTTSSRMRPRQISQPMRVIPNDSLVKTLKDLSSTPSKKPRMEKIIDALSNPQNIPLSPLMSLPQDLQLNDYVNRINSLFGELGGIENNKKCKCYDLGMYLRYAKEYCELNNIGFLILINQSLVIKSLSQINNYIAFYKIVHKYPLLLNCKLTFTDIVSNRKNIINFLSNSQVN
jgi:hypothetical protein